MENSSSPRNHSGDLAAIIFSVTGARHHTPPVFAISPSRRPQADILKAILFKNIVLKCLSRRKNRKTCEGLPVAVFYFFCKKKRNASKCIPHFTFALKFNFKDMISNKLKFANKWFLRFKHILGKRWEVQFYHMRHQNMQILEN